MNTKIILTVLGILIVSTATYFVITNKNTDTKNQISNESTPISNSENIDSSSTPQSLKELLTLKQDIRCEFNTDEENNNSSGVVQASNGKARVDFTAISNNSGQETINGHMIMADDIAYTWLDSESKGYKISIEKITEVENTANSSQIDPNKKMDYRCTNVAIDNSVFNIPDNIEFTDVSSMMTPSGQGEIKSDTSATMEFDPKALQCAACDQAPEASRAQCRIALGCN
jgi:hypothetical protein